MDASRAEEALARLATAGLQLGSAATGARIADLAQDPERREGLLALASDYGGVATAAINLVARCSTTCVDLCAAALGRLLGDRRLGPEYEWDCGEIRKRDKKGQWQKLPNAPHLDQIMRTFVARINEQSWIDIERLRHAVTHRMQPLGVVGATDAPTIGVGGQQVPVDHLSWEIVDTACDIFEQVCDGLRKLP